MPTKVLTNDGKQAIRDLLQSETEDLAVGTDGTEASATDTDLGNQVIAKTPSTEDDSDGTGLYVIRLGSSDANGEALRELGSKTDDGSLLSRVVFSEIQKTSDFEVEFRLRKTVQNP